LHREIAKNALQTRNIAEVGIFHQPKNLDKQLILT
jgi:hypothetical protein